MKSPKSSNEKATSPRALAFLAALLAVAVGIPTLIYGIRIIAYVFHVSQYAVQSERYEQLARTGPQGHKLTLSPVESVEAIGSDLKLCPEDFANCARVTGAANVVSRIRPGDSVVIFGDLKSDFERDRVPGERYTHIFQAASIRLERKGTTIIFDSESVADN